MVNRVQVDIGNPITRTTAGKLELAKMMGEMKLISNPHELLSVITTGNLDTLTEGPMNELLAIRAENEALGEGKEVPAFVTDTHGTHLLEHKSLLSDPAVRMNPELMDKAMQHISMHWALWTDPANASLMAALGISPPPVDVPVRTGNLKRGMQKQVTDQELILINNVDYAPHSCLTEVRNKLLKMSLKRLGISCPSTVCSRCNRCNGSSG